MITYRIIHSVQFKHVIVRILSSTNTIVADNVALSRLRLSTRIEPKRDFLSRALTVCKYIPLTGDRRLFFELTISCLWLTFGAFVRSKDLAEVKLKEGQGGLFGIVVPWY